MVSASALLNLPAGLQVLSYDLTDNLLTLHVASTTPSSVCPGCQCQTSRIHSRYTRKVADLACGGRQIQMLLAVRKFFCPNKECARKIFTERLAPFLEPWARVTSRLSQAIESISLATGGRLGVRLGIRLGIATSLMTLLRRVMDLPSDSEKAVSTLGIDDFSFRRGRTFGTVLVDLDEHRPIDLLPDRQTESAKAWMQSHPEIEYVSRDGGSQYASAASAGAPQAIQVADRYHIVQNLSEAVQELLARVLTEMKQASEANEQKESVGPEPTPHLLPIEEWRPAQGKDVKQTILTRRAERSARYQQIMALRDQGLNSQAIAARLGMKDRTVRDWLKAGAAPGAKQRRKYPSDFDPYAPYILKRRQEGEHNGQQLWREIVAQGYKGSNRMVYRFLETLKTTEIVASNGTHRLPHYSSRSAIWLFMRRPKDLDEIEQEDLAAFRLANPVLSTTYRLAQDFLHMVRYRKGERLDAWLAKVAESGPEELQSFAHGIEQDKDAVRAGLTLHINNGQVEGQVTKIKLIKRMMYGRATFPLLRQRVLHAI